MSAGGSRFQRPLQGWRIEAVSRATDRGSVPVPQGRYGATHPRDPAHGPWAHSGWPGEELTIKSLASPIVQSTGDFYLIEDADIESIHLLGHEGKLSWNLTSNGLKIKMPSEKPCDYAYTIKIVWSDYANQ